MTAERFFTAAAAAHLARSLLHLRRGSRSRGTPERVICGAGCVNIALAFHQTCARPSGTDAASLE